MTDIANRDRLQRFIRHLMAHPEQWPPELQERHRRFKAALRDHLLYGLPMPDEFKA